MSNGKILQNVKGMELARCCANNDESGAMMILNDADCCKLDYTMEFPHSFSYGCKILYTPLMFACNNRMIKVCNELLLYPDKCGLNYKTLYNVSALSLANNQGLDEISAKIIQCKRSMKK